MRGWRVVAAVLSFLVGAGGTAAEDLIETATEAGQFKMLLQAVRAAGMDGALKNPGPFTVFAPPDAAFEALSAGKAENLLKPENKHELAKLLSYHVVVGRLPLTEVKGKNAAVNTLGGQAVVVNGQGEPVMVNEARVVQPDVRADNGVIHVIDKVLIPPTPIQPKT